MCYYIYSRGCCNMDSRMEKYHEIDIDEFQRSKKNASLYKEVYGNYGDFEDLPIPDFSNEIDIENLKSLVGSRSSKMKEKLEEQEFDFDDEINYVHNEEKVYDINTLLEKAKEENAKIKKEVPVNKNIPNYLANLESDKNTKEIILKHEKDYDADMPIVKEVKYSTSEINFTDNSISTASLSLDILSDLKPTGNTLVDEPIVSKDMVLEEEKNEFFDTGVKLSKLDFDDSLDEEDEEFLDGEKDNDFLKILLIILGLSSVFTAAFFILKEYTNIF